MNSKSFYIWFGTPVLVVLIWIFAAYMPMKSAADKKEIELTAIKKERQQLDLSIQGVTLNAQVQEKLRQSYTAFVSQAPLIERMPEYMKNTVRMAKERGIAVNSLHGYYTSLDAAGRPGFMNPVFEAGLMGNFLDIGTFLEELSGRVGFKSINAAKISCDEKDYPVVSGKFVIEFKALRGQKGESK